MLAASPALLVSAMLASTSGQAPATPVRAAPEGATGTHELRVHLVLSKKPHGTEPERDRIRQLEEELLGLLSDKDAGRLERDAWSDGVCVITIAAPDARRAWETIEGAVRAMVPRPGSYAALRPGPVGTQEERVPLDPAPTPPP